MELVALPSGARLLRPRGPEDGPRGRFFYQRGCRSALRRAARKAVRRNVAAAPCREPGARSPEPFDLVEAGAGNGRLSRDVLDAAQRDDPEFYAAIRLSLVEHSAPRAPRRPRYWVHTLRASISHSAALAGFPTTVHGVIFANELLDALPTHAVAMSDEGLREVFVDYRDGQIRRDPAASRPRRGLPNIWRAPAPRWRRAGARK